MTYLRAILKDDDSLKKQALKKLVIVGQKIGEDTSKYKKELLSLGEEINYPKKTKFIDNKPKEKKTTTTKKSTKFDIQSISTSYNSIIVNFNRKVRNTDINFFELHYKNLNKDIFDIKGKYEFAKESKLKIKGVDKIYVGQFKKDILRIVVRDKRDVKTKFYADNNRLIIKISDIKTKAKNIKKRNPKFDIENVEVDGNSILVKFNRRVTKRDLKYIEQNYKSKNRDIFHIKGKFEHARPTKLEMEGVDKISISQYKTNILRVVLTNRTNLKTIYRFDKDKIVIKVLNIKISKKESKIRQIIPTLPVPIVKLNNPDRVIVIDAGHGGKDVGAVGPNKRYEKKVVFNIAKDLHLLLKKRGYKVYLTRTKDRYIKVRNRTILANKKNADIFISIHANAVPKRRASKVKGIETFFLSPARSERAKRVAALENKSDIEDMGYASKASFLTVLNQSKITQSYKLAIDVQQNLLYYTRNKYKGVVDGGVREGPFWVLVGAQMPSILVEVGYISHPMESRRLYNRRYQKTLAKGIANGIDSYFSKNQ